MSLEERRPRSLREVVFVDGVRTPFGKAGPKGIYAETRADDLVVRVIRELLRRNPASSAAVRPMVRPWSPICVVAAMATSSTRSGGSCGCRRSSARTQLTTRSSARVSL